MSPSISAAIETSRQQELVRRLRSQTRGVENVVHLNNAGASLPPDRVLAAVKRHLDLEAAIGGYEAAAAAEADLSRFYEAAADFIGGKPHEVAFAENATRAWDMVFYAFPWRSGDRIITCQAEYGSNYLAFLQIARKFGVEIDVVPNDGAGQVSLDALERSVNDTVRLIAITHVPTNGGLVNPAAAVGRIAKARDIPFLLDSCQSIGQLKIDVAAIGCDMLVATGRKFLRGPRGTGFLWIREAWLDALDPPFLDIRSARCASLDTYVVEPTARRFECWESYVAGKIGLGAAIEYAAELGVDWIEERVCSLASSLRAKLASIPGVALHDLGVNRCGIVSFTVDGATAKDIVSRLRAKLVNVSYSEPEATPVDSSRRSLTGLVRASVHYFNIESEIDGFCSEIEALARGGGLD